MYPRWWFDFNRELARFVARVFAYCALLDDRYSLDRRQQGVRFEFDYPEAKRDSTGGSRSSMAARDPALHRAVLPLDRGVLRGRVRLVRDPVHRPVPARAVRLRRRCRALARTWRRTRRCSSPIATRCSACTDEPAVSWLAACDHLLSRGAPSLDIVDVEGLREASQQAFDTDPAGTVAYGTSVGYVPLREWIAEQHGVAVEQVLVTNGSMQADAFLLGSSSARATRSSWSRRRTTARC